MPGSEVIGIDTGAQARSRAFWAINPATGSDSAAGWGTSKADAATRPLRTAQELIRRLGSGEVQRPVVHIYGNLVAGDSLRTGGSLHGAYPITGGTGRGGITWIGEPTVIASGTLSAVTIPSSSVSYKYLVTATWTGAPSASTKASGPVFIRKTTGDVRAAVLASEGGGAYSISQPVASNPNLAMSGVTIAAADFAPGDAVEMYTVPTVGAFGGGCYASLQQLNLSHADGFIVDDSRGYAALLCGLNSPNWRHVGVGGETTFAACVLLDTVSVIGGNGLVFLFRCGGVAANGTWATVLFTGTMARCQELALDNYHVYASQGGHVDVSGSVYNFPAGAVGPTGENGAFVTDEGGEITIGGLRGHVAETLCEAFTPAAKFNGVGGNADVVSDAPNKLLKLFTTYYPKTAVPIRMIDVPGWIVDGFQAGSSYGWNGSRFAVGTSNPGAKVDVESSDGIPLKLGDGAGDTLTFSVGGVQNTLTGSGNRKLQVILNGVTVLDLDPARGTLSNP